MSDETIIHLKVAQMPPRATTGHPLADKWIEDEVKAALSRVEPILIEAITESVRHLLQAGKPKG